MVVLSIFCRFMSSLKTPDPSSLLQAPIAQCVSCIMTAQSACQGKKTLPYRNPAHYKDKSLLLCKYNELVLTQEILHWLLIFIHFFSTWPSAHYFKKHNISEAFNFYVFLKGKQQLQYRVSKCRNYLFNVPDPVPNIFKRFFIGDVID